MARKHLKYLLIGIAVIIVLFFLTVFGMIAISKIRVDRQQAKLEPFYQTSGLPLDGPMGEIVRQEPLGVSVDGGTGLRVLYRTQQANGSPTFSSGMIFIPSTPATSPRPILAWAHGTLGMGEQCAPTRTPNPLDYVPGLSEMLKNGWVVTATDYAGLGTPGIQQYLVGRAEAYDVLNSVRAARSLGEAQAGSTFAVWGHSQGGQSALFTAHEAASYAPELQLAGTVAAAPAAELLPLLNEQFNSAADWVIGPEVVISWPSANPNLSIEEIVTPAGQRSYQKIANRCIGVAALGGLIRTNLKQRFFSANPADVPDWQAEARRQTAPVLAADQPVMVAESTTDQVVLPDTTALYIANACAAGSDITTLWLSDVTHMELAKVIAPNALAWIGDRFANRPTSPTCNQPLPVAPAASL